MTVRDYERLFAPSIRALFNFDRARRERWPVRTHVIRDRDELGLLLLPWRHVARSATVQTHVGEGGVPHTVASAARVLWALDERRRADVLEEAHAWLTGHPRAIVLPAVRTGSGLHLLDGCHRAVGIHLAGADIAILIAAIAVPRNVDWSFIDA